MMLVFVAAVRFDTHTGLLCLVLGNDTTVAFTN